MVYMIYRDNLLMPTPTPPVNHWYETNIYPGTCVSLSMEMSLGSPIVANFDPMESRPFMTKLSTPRLELNASQGQSAIVTVAPDYREHRLPPHSHVVTDDFEL